MEIDIELDILPTGEIRFSREKGEGKQSLLSDVLLFVTEEPEKVEKIKRNFLKKANQREIIFGKEVLCG